MAAATGRGTAGWRAAGVCAPGRTGIPVSADGQPPMGNASDRQYDPTGDSGSRTPAAMSREAAASGGPSHRVNPNPAAWITIRENKTKKLHSVGTLDQSVPLVQLHGPPVMNWGGHTEAVGRVGACPRSGTTRAGRSGRRGGPSWGAGRAATQKKLAHPEIRIFCANTLCRSAAIQSGTPPNRG